MSDTLSKLEKRTAYTLVLPAVLLVFAIVLFPIFANVWISFKDIELKDIRIPEPRAKKIVRSIFNDFSKGIGNQSGQGISRLFNNSLWVILLIKGLIDW